MTSRNATRLGAIGILLSSAALADGHLDEMGPEELLPLAQEEGTVTVYSFTSRIGRVETAFEEAYPGIDLQGFDISSTEQIARLRAEAQAGVTNADVVYTSDTPVVLGELLETGIVRPYVPPRVAERVPQNYREPLLAQRLSTKVLMYNEEAHPDGAPVTNLWQLTTEDWRGRVVMVDPLQRGDYLDLMTEIVLRADEMAGAYEAQFGKALALDGATNAGEQFIVDLFANNVILVGSTDDVNVAVGATGQEAPPVGFTSYSDRCDNEDEGWALQVANEVEPAPGIIFPAVLALAAEPNNPAAARLVIDFLMGDESETGGPGLAPFYVAGDYVTRTDIPPHPDAVPLDTFNAWRIAPAETATIRAEIGDLILTLQ
ncbi:ABC transporter substrate-binding protein [Jannaschia sp. S6380]|uniref:ABC transporter substrate-binding protein n=1 Tax=Jannaschia sp. S6380 TaxID=2926408 RepID=UPI001FF4DE50|nr:ABC transporter substrate-binding protein [Jannaschia sp. S6380]MCK0168197.1 ABC transporter substrate-binding protein [Jannaschia sp. S6380]